MWAGSIRGKSGTAAKALRSKVGPRVGVTRRHCDHVITLNQSEASIQVT